MDNEVQEVASVDKLVEVYIKIRDARDEVVRDRKSTRLNSSHSQQSRMPSSA